MHHITIYAPQSSPRLKYVLDWLVEERFGCAYTLVHNINGTDQSPIAISYGIAIPDCISIPDIGLLRETDIHACETKKGLWEDLPVMFSIPSEGYTVPFDMLSAVFFLLSRYEEYYPYTPDKHNRYPATASILYKEGWLMRPLVDEWVGALHKLLLSVTGKNILMRPFFFEPTYDIDIAYAHLHKGFVRTAGAYLKTAIKADILGLKSRTLSLARKQQDPYDSFDWMQELHQKYGYHPIFFVLSTLKTTAFDKNILPTHPAMTTIIQKLTKNYTIGMHPSYFSNDDAVFDSEKKVLERIINDRIYVSRQHYIKFTLPQTYRKLMSKGIYADFSMGYGTHLGFRAGTGASFLWFDIEKNHTTQLRVNPFCFMDSTAHYELGLTAQEAFEKLEALTQTLTACNSTLITVFHNFSLGTDSEWAGWREAYRQFMVKMCKNP